MGLNIRPISGRIANGSRLIVAGQPTTGSKVFQITFSRKESAPRDKNPDILPPTLTPSNTPTVTPTVTPTPSVTPSITPTITPTPNITPSVTLTPTLTPTGTPANTPTPSITPTPTASSPVVILMNPIITENDEYIDVGNDEYLMFR